MTVLLDWKNIIQVQVGLCQEHWVVCPGSCSSQVGSLHSGKRKWKKIFWLKIFQRHAGLECRHSVMAAEHPVSFTATIKVCLSISFLGRRLSGFITLKHSVLKAPSLSVRQFRHKCQYYVYCLLFGYKLFLVLIVYVKDNSIWLVPPPRGKFSAWSHSVGFVPCKIL